MSISMMRRPRTPRGLVPIAALAGAVLMGMAWQGCGRASATPADEGVTDDIAGVAALVASSGLSRSGKRKLRAAFRSAGGVDAPAESLSALMKEAATLTGTPDQGPAEVVHNVAWRLLRALGDDKATDDGIQGFARRSSLVRTRADLEGVGAMLRVGEPRLATRRVDDDVYTQLFVHGLLAAGGKPGSIGVPVIRTFVAVPRGASVSVAGTPTVGLETAVNLFPHQPEPFDERTEEELYATPPFERDAAAHAVDAAHPPKVCWVDGEHRTSGLKLAAIACAAGQYNPVSHRLEVFHTVEVDVVFSGGRQQWLRPKPRRLSDLPARVPRVLNPAGARAELRTKRGELQEQGDAAETCAESDAAYWGGLFDAFGLPREVEPAWDDDGFESAPAAIPDSLNCRVCGGEELLVVTTADLAAAAADFAVHKNERGIVTNVAVTPAGLFDQPLDSQREWLHTLIQARSQLCWMGPKYALLLGDAELIPPYETPREPTSDKVDIATDYWYGVAEEVTKDVTGLLDRLELGTQPSVPPVAIGRIPVDTLEQASDVLGKSMAYEASPPTLDSYYERATVAASFECCRATWDDGSGQTLARDDRPYIEAAEDAYTLLTDRGYTVDRIYSKHGGSDGIKATDVIPTQFENGDLFAGELQSPFPWSGAATDIQAAMADGRFLVIHRDHGSNLGWSNPEFLRKHVGKLADDSEPAAVFSINCVSGLFDNEIDIPRNVPVEEDKTYFVEAFLRRPTGGTVAMVAATRITRSGINNRLLAGMLDAMWPGVPGQERVSRLGDVLNQGKESLLGTYVPDQPTANHLLLYGAFGDPTLEIWTAQPETLPDSVTVVQKQQGIVIKYAEDGAVVTAWVEVPRGVIPIGRATVKNGKVRVKLPPRFMQGRALRSLKKKLRLSASMPGRVSVPLTIEWEE